MTASKTCSVAQLLGSARIPLSQFLLAAGLLGTPAMAQDAIAAPPTEEEAKPPAADRPTDGGIADIVVTANRRAQNLQDVALSVSAFGEEQMEDLNIRSGADLGRISPGLFITSGFAGQNQQFTIRGVAQNDFNDIFEGPIAVFYDDTYMTSMQGQVFGTFDLDRIEVLKGPQGTLFGKNATGGLIHFIPNKPTRELDGFVEASYGRFNQVRLEAAVGGPLGGNLRARASGYYSWHDPYVKNLYPAGATFLLQPPPGPPYGEDVGKQDVLAGRLQLEADLSERLNVRLTGSAARSNMGTGPYTSRAIFPVFNAAGQHIDTVAPGPGTPDGLGFIAPRPSSRLTSSDYSREDGFFARSYDATLHANYDLDSFEIISVTSFKRFEKKNIVDVDATAVNFLAVGSYRVAKSITQELRAVGQTPGGLKWTTGLFFSKGDANSDLAFLAPSNSLFASFFGPFLAVTGVDMVNVMQFENTNYSVFGSVDLPVSSQLTLTVGGRLIHERLRFDFASNAYLNSDDYDIETQTFLFPLQASFHGKTSDTLWAGKINLEYRPIEDTLLYAGVNRGVKGGAFNNKLPDGTPDLQPDEFPYDPEVLVSYEVGAKTSLLEDRIRLNAAAFYYDYSDYQTFVFRNLSGLVANNDATAWGGELGLQFAFSKALRGSASAAYTKARVKDLVIAAATPTAPAVISDVDPTFSPRFQAMGNLAYDLPFRPFGGKLTALGDVSHISSFYDNSRNFQAAKHDGYTLLNLGLTWLSPDETLSVRGYIENVTDKLYTVTSFDTSPFCGCGEYQYSRPRWWTLSLRKEF